MKNKVILMIFLSSLGLFTACSGDHGAHTGKDTVINTYKTTKDSSNIDTSKITSADKSATGGAGNTTDTAKKTKK